MGAAAATVDEVATAIDFDALARELVGHYAAIDKIAEGLPFFTPMPFLWFLWGVVKFEVALLGDILLILPINLIILLRNVFPGHGRYVCWSWKYFVMFKTWIWSGECYAPVIHFKPLVIFLLHAHFKSRALLLRRRILLESEFSEEAAKPALARIDRASAFWGSTSLGSLVLTWTPIAISLGGVVKPFLSFDLPDWTGFVILICLGYVMGVLITAFLAKRGILLGGRGEAALYPGFLPGPGFYETERRIFAAAGLRVSEFPLDAGCLFANAVVSLMALKTEMRFYSEIVPAQSRMSDASYLLASAGGAVAMIVIVAVGLSRRRKLERA